jgi:hypothetical protein
MSANMLEGTNFGYGPKWSPVSRRGFVTADEDRHALQEWRRSRPPLREVTFTEKSVEPDPNSFEDYVVIFEADFEPKSLCRATFGIWVTDDGHIAIHFEKLRRFTRRVKARTIRPLLGCLGGHEPTDVSIPALIELLDCVAGGKVHVVYTKLFGFVWGVRPAIAPEDKERLIKAGYRQTFWLKRLPTNVRGASRGLRRLARYEPWLV